MSGKVGGRNSGCLRISRIWASRSWESGFWDLGPLVGLAARRCDRSEGDQSHLNKPQRGSSHGNDPGAPRFVYVYRLGVMSARRRARAPPLHPGLSVRGFVCLCVLS